MEIKDKYRGNVILHNWWADIDLTVDAIKAFGFGGVVTNVPGENGFTSNKENVSEFAKIVTVLHRRGLEYWIYDEVGYPSGQAGGLTLAGHPEFAAKGLYMRKFEAFLEPLDFTYTIDGASDYIYSAYRYKQDLSDTCEARILYDAAEPLPFAQKSIEIRLEQGEVCYVFIVKNAYEGAHTVHNISSRKKYINLLSEDAVEEFIRQAYEPIRDGAKDAYPQSRAVFTDEPSLMIAYAREFETFNYALIPFEKNLFDKFEQAYGYNIKGLLPLLFESTDERYRQLRRDFYQLIGEIVACAYTKKISTFCRQNGTVFSGHYLAEETVAEHVMNYGNFVRVLTESGYPGMDILQVTPKKFFWNAPKFLQMIARKKGADGFMVELCPFFNKEEFDRNPFENAIGSLGILLMYGARKINTYFMPNLCEYDKVSLAKYKGSMSQKDSVYFNEYIGRIASLLEGSRCENGTYVYYAVEDVQVKFIPSVCGRYSKDKELSKLDDSLTRISECLLPKGIEYAFCDEGDLEGEFTAKRIVVPEIDFITAAAAEKLQKAESRGCEIVFLMNRPRLVETGEQQEGAGKVLSYEELAEAELAERKAKQELLLPDNIYLQHYENGFLYVYNNNLSACFCTPLRKYVCYDPCDGSESVLGPGVPFAIQSYRAVILRECR